jgi:hypothetical protein
MGGLVGAGQQLTVAAAWIFLASFSLPEKFTVGN